MKITEDTYTVTIPESVKIREAVFEAIIDWMIEHGAYIGEAIIQTDDCIMDAPE